MDASAIQIIPILDDNYVFAYICPHSREVAIVDPGDVEPVINFLNKNDLFLSHILITHHHYDHTQGVSELQKKYGARVWGNKFDKHRLPALDSELQPGHQIQIGGTKFEIIDLSGHTIGHIGYYAPDGGFIFVGDTLFVMGCGRLYEGSPAQMWNSLKKIRALPGNTKIFCTHEYSVDNAKFAAESFPNFSIFTERFRELEVQRKKGHITIPTTVQLENETNPFLLADSEYMQNQFPEIKNDPAKIFGKIRVLKDNF